MKWEKTETIKSKGKETRTTIIYDDIVSVLTDFMCPDFCENCVLGVQSRLLDGRLVRRCSILWCRENEQEAANLMGVKPFEGEGICMRV